MTHPQSSTHFYCHLPLSWRPWWPFCSLTITEQHYRSITTQINNIKNMTMVSPRLCMIVLVATSAAAFSPSQRMRSVSRSHCASPSSFRSPSCLFSETNSSSSNDYDDFAEFSSTQLTSSNDDAEDSDSFLSSLQSRVQQVQDQSNTLVSTYCYH